MGLVIATALSKVTDDYDYVIIDSPPMLGVLMVNALAACQHLIIPVLSEFLAIKGLERMLHTIDMVFHSRKNAPDFTILPTQFDKRTKAALLSLRALRDGYPEHVWKSVIPVDTKLREASREGLPASLYAPACRAVASYTELLESLLPDKDHLQQKLAKAG